MALKMRSITDYLRPYGTIQGKRGSNLRSFFVRVKAAFDLPENERIRNGLEVKLGFVSDDPRCVFCDEKALEWDHLIKAADGGGHQIGNLVPACSKCNARKTDWKAHLRSLKRSDEETRLSRIVEYTDLLQTGHKLFNEAELIKLQAAERKIFEAIAEADAVIKPAIDRCNAQTKVMLRRK
jgi:hypothetical protein